MIFLNFTDPRTTRYNKNFLIELLLSIFTVSILAGIAMPIYSNYIASAKLIHVAGRLHDTYSMYVFNAVNGMWPESTARLKVFEAQMGFSSMDGDYQADDYVKKVDIVDGAVNFTLLLSENQEEQTLTLRPAIPDNDPEGPVILVCGHSRSGWVLSGKDNTTVNDELISRYFK